MYRLRRLTIACGVLGGLVVVIWLLPGALNPTPPTPEARKRDRDWVNSSPYFLDRQACRWFSLCGIHHIKHDPAALRGPHDGGDLRRAKEELRKRRSLEQWNTERDRDHVETRATTLQPIPDYVLAHAPLVHLFSGENFWPSDIAEHVRHMAPVTNGSRYKTPQRIALGNMARQLNAPASTVFLTSQVDVETRPEWLHNHAGIPAPYHDDTDRDDTDGKQHREGWRKTDDWPSTWPRPSPGGGGDTTWWDADKKHPPHRIADPRLRPLRPSQPRRGFVQRRRQEQQAVLPQALGSSHHKPNASGYSTAPAVLVLVDKGAGILDAFWFFFYSYNLGQTVARIRFGNHVGDWEHCMVRFERGAPRAMFLSEHAGGKAYAWAALEKRGGRPVIYSAVGSHAMYASPGEHPYVLPFNMLRDQTDRGPLWDPVLHRYAYWFDYERDAREGDRRNVTSLAPAAENPHAQTDWFHFRGLWGDDVYALRDTRQWRLFGEYHYVEGPLGPKFKHLERKKVCQGERCRMLRSIEEGKRANWYS